MHVCDALGWSRCQSIDQMGFDATFGQWSAYGQLRRVFESFWRLENVHFSSCGLDCHGLWCQVQQWFHSFQQALADWVLDENWVLSGPWCSLCWDHLSLDDLKIMLAEAWQQTICARVAHRKDSEGWPTIDVSLSFRSCRAQGKAW